MIVMKVFTVALVDRSKPVGPAAEADRCSTSEGWWLDACAASDAQQAAQESSIPTPLTPPHSALRCRPTRYYYISNDISLSGAYITV